MMQKYVEQLLMDISQANDQVNDFKIRQQKSSATPLSLEDDLQKAEFISLERLLGIPAEAFPPAYKLEAFQIELIIHSLKWTLFKYGYELNYPEKVSPSVIYSVIVKNMLKKIPLLQHNIWKLSFCGYDTQQCPYGKFHCQCAAWEEILSLIPFDSRKRG